MIIFHHMILLMPLNGTQCHITSQMREFQARLLPILQLVYPGHPNSLQCYAPGSATLINLVLGWLPAVCRGHIQHQVCDDESDGIAPSLIGNKRSCCQVKNYTLNDAMNPLRGISHCIVTMMRFDQGQFKTNTSLRRTWSFNCMIKLRNTLGAERLLNKTDCAFPHLYEPVPVHASSEKSGSTCLIGGKQVYSFSQIGTCLPKATELIVYVKVRCVC